MIIGLIIRLIKKIIDLVAAFIAWLFVVLGLWIPFVYCLVFVIICAIKGIELSTVTGLFFVGLFLSLFASVVLSVYVAGQKFKKKEKRDESTPNLSKRKDKVRLVQSDYYDQEEEYEQPVNTQQKEDKKPKLEKEKQEEPSPKKPINIIEAAKADRERKLIEDGYMDEKNLEEKKKKDYSDIKKSLFHRDDDDYDNEPEQKQNFQIDDTPVVTKGGYNPNEMPRIFATRKDPTVFIYEYSNRLDFYKRTRSGMIYMYSEYKS